MTTEDPHSRAMPTATWISETSRTEKPIVRAATVELVVAALSVATRSTENMATTLRVRLVSTRTSPTLAWPKMDSLHYLGDTGRGNTFLSATAVRAADIGIKNHEKPGPDPHQDPADRGSHQPEHRDPSLVSNVGLRQGPRGGDVRQHEIRRVHERTRSQLDDNAQGKKESHARPACCQRAQHNGHRDQGRERSRHDHRNRLREGVLGRCLTLTR